MDNSQPAFAVSSQNDLDRESLLALCSGALAAVHLPGRVSRNECVTAMGKLDAIPLQTYDTERVFPPIARLGPVLNDYREDGALHAGYWDDASVAEKVRRDALGSNGLLVTCQAALSAAWGQPLTTTSVQGRPVFAGIVREIGAGAHIHFDDVRREFPRGLFDQQLTAQLAFNLFLSVPDEGGETTIWRRTWQESDDQHRLGYGYAPHVVDDVPNVRLAPKVGDMIMFNPCHYHGVAPSHGGRRVTLSFFVGVTSDSSLVHWS